MKEMKKRKNKKNKKQKSNLPTIIIIAIGVIFIIIAIFVLFITLDIQFVSNNSNATSETLSPNTVIDVIDGDTFTLYSGDKVRLLCIDTPEVGQNNYEEAKDFLTNLILGKEVILKNGNDNIDKYGRLLRFVYLNDTESGNLIFVNHEMLMNNFTGIFNYGNQTDCKENLK